MVNLTSRLYEVWKNRLSEDYPQEQDSIAVWLFGGCEDSDLSPSQVTQFIDYRYRIFQKRYVNTSQKQGYTRLIRRLSAIILEYPPINRKFSEKSNYQSFILALTQRVLEDMLHRDSEVQKIMDEIEQYTAHSSLKEALLLASLEEYGSQLINGQPRIIHSLRQLLGQHQPVLSA